MATNGNHNLFLRRLERVDVVLLRLEHGIQPDVEVLQSAAAVAHTLDRFVDFLALSPARLQRNRKTKRQMTCETADLVITEKKTRRR